MEEFAFSEAGLVLASNSLFFCQPERFDETLHKMLNNLVSSGIFLGDFVGPEDSWVHSPNHSVHAVTKNALDVLFCDFDILALHERDELAPTALGNMKHWHTFTVLARKN
jgi:hypothetical protein